VLVGVTLAALAIGLFFLYRTPVPRIISEEKTPAKSIESRKAPAPFRVTMLPRKRRMDANEAANLLKSIDRSSASGQLVLQLLDESLPLKTRRTAATALAKLGTDESFQALNAGLLSTNSMVKAAIAEALGESTHPDAAALLNELLNDEDEALARGAVRGIAAKGDVAAANTLSAVLFDSGRSEDLRAEAAISLGEIPQPEALSALARAVNEIQDEAIIEQVWEGLGNRPFSETEELFRAYLNSPNLTAGDKVMALEALGSAEGNVAPLLMAFSEDPDPEVRAAAAWGLVSAESQPEVGSRMVEWLGRESDPEVRGRLYEALSTQENLDPAAALALAQRETDPAARLSALGMAAAALDAESPSPELLAYFNEIGVPELQRTAVSSADLGERLNAIMALGRAATPEALQTLQDIINNSRDTTIIEAAQSIIAHRGH
jgi:HEAT repeat protein